MDIVDVGFLVALVVVALLFVPSALTMAKCWWSLVKEIWNSDD